MLLLLLFFVGAAGAAGAVAAAVVFCVSLLDALCYTPAATDSGMVQELAAEIVYCHS